MMPKYFEDIQIGDVQALGGYTVTESEMVEFARKWDPLPIHVDPESTQALAHGGLIASGQYTLAVKQKMITRMEFIGASVIGAIGWDELRFPNPVRPGQHLSLTVECIDKRPSRSKPDRGIVKFIVTMSTQHDETVLSYLDLVMVRKRATDAQDVA